MSSLTIGRGPDRQVGAAVGTKRRCLPSSGFGSSFVPAAAEPGRISSRRPSGAARECI